MRFVILSLIVFATTIANAATSNHSSYNDVRVKATCTCPDDYPLMDTNGYCYSCDYTEVINLANRDTCESICNGRNGTTKRVSVIFGCKLENCPKDMPLENTFGECLSCQYDAPVSDIKNCSLCPNREVQDGKCVISDCSDRPLLSYDGFCYPCSTKLAVETFRGECTTVCPNRRESGSWSNVTDGGVISGSNCGLR